jgi:hypothetical protein
MDLIPNSRPEQGRNTSDTKQNQQEIHVIHIPQSTNTQGNQPFQQN